MLFSANKGKTAISERQCVPKSLLLIIVLAAGGFFSARALADGNSALQDTAQRLAERVAAIPGLHGPLRLEWHPDGQWSEGESDHWQVALRVEFEKRSVNLTEDAAVPALALYAEETPTQVVLTAKTRVAEREEVRLVAVARALLPPGTQPVAPMRLERQMIYESSDRILDASSLWNAAEGGLALLLYRNFEVIALRMDSSGALKQIVPLSAANLKPTRDPRAEMTPRGIVVSVQLWGKACEFSWESPADVKCRLDKPSPTAQPAWRGATLLISPCDGSSWKLLNSGTEFNTKDVLQLVPAEALRESSAVVLSEFPGPILSANEGQNPGGALVVVRNLRTGNYEVYKIGLACGN